MYFLQISDTHFLEDYSLNHDLFETAFLNMTSPLEKITKIKEELPQVKLDFLVHCGDICHSGQKGDYLRLKAHLEETFPGVPLVMTCGNRDDVSLVEEVFYGEGGGFPYEHDFGDLQVIAYNNANGTPQGDLRPEMCQAVGEKLTQGKATILCGHHHCIPEQIASMKAVDCPGEFEDVCQSEGLVALLTGHTHHGYEGFYHGLPCFTVPSLSFVAKAKEGGQDVYEEGGYHLFSYEEGVLTLEKVGDLGYHHKIGETK